MRARFENLSGSNQGTQNSKEWQVHVGVDDKCGNVKDCYFKALFFSLLAEVFVNLAFYSENSLTCKEGLTNNVPILYFFPFLNIYLLYEYGCFVCTPGEGIDAHPSMVIDSWEPPREC